MGLQCSARGRLRSLRIERSHQPAFADLAQFGIAGAMLQYPMSDEAKRIRLLFGMTFRNSCCTSCALKYISTAAVFKLDAATKAMMVANGANYIKRNTNIAPTPP